MFKFGSDGKFKILLFGDLHEKEDYTDEGRLKFLDMHKMMNAALDEYKPDLCVLLGDNCSTSTIFSGDDREAFKKLLGDIIEPIKRRSIPVAAILGNHEHDNGDATELVKPYQEVGVIIRNDSPPEVTGKANFTEQIYSSDGSRPVFNLWFIDSNNVCDNKGISNYDWVHADQIDWYEREAARLKTINGGEPMPAFVFQHTPVPEEYRLLKKAMPWQIPVSVRGHSHKRAVRYVAREGVSGYVGEGPCAPDYNSGQFESWKRTGDVIAAFFGHDHLNDFSGYVDGILLAQHKTAGFRAYTDGARSCVRLITIDERNPRNFTHELKHFKEFGLKCECLGPIFKRITDRQSINITIASRVAASAAVSVMTAVMINKLKKKRGGKK